MHAEDKTSMRRWRVLVLATLCLVLVGGASAATYMTESFEDGDYNSNYDWNVNSGPSSDVVVNTDNPFKGSYSIKLTPDSGSEDMAVNWNGAPQLTGDRYYEAWYYAGSLNFEDVSFSIQDAQGRPWDANAHLSAYWNGPDGQNFYDYAQPASSSGSGVSVSLQNWYRRTIQFDDSAEQVTFSAFYSNETKIYSQTFSYDDESNSEDLTYADLFARGNSGGTRVVYFDSICIADSKNECVNDKPQFNSTSVTPDPPLIGENVSYSAEVYDLDGSIQYTNLTVTYGGSTVVSDEKRTGTTPSWTDIYKPTSGNKWLNTTFETVDDAGAVTTTSLNRYLKDTDPQASLTSPTGTQYSYSQSFSVSTSKDGDNRPNEDLYCVLDLDGSQIDQRTVTEGTDYTVSDRADLGSHTASLTCTETDDNRQNIGSTSFTVEDLTIKSSSANTPVYETTTQGYSAAVKVGDMVQQVNQTLIYDDVKRGTVSNSPTGITTFTLTNNHEVGLVANNNTALNWKNVLDYSYTGFSGSTKTSQENTSINSQSVYHSYYIVSNKTMPANGKYIERQDLKHKATVHTETKKASLTGTTTYLRDGSTDSMTTVNNQSKSVTLQGSLDVGPADSFNKSTFNAESSFTVSFNGESRTFTTGQVPVKVYRIKLTDGSTSLNTAPALKFDTDYEENGYDVKTDLKMDISVFKDRSEKVRRFSFISNSSKVHTFNIYPAWAQYQIRTLDYPNDAKFDIIQYEPSYVGGALRSYFFPKSQTINNKTTTIPLLTINRSETNRIDFEITDPSGDPAVGTVCRADRKFPGKGEHKTVFMIKTGSQGKSQSFAEVNEIYYRFICYNGNQVADTFGDQIMQDPMRLQLGAGDSLTSLDFTQKFDASCTVNTTTITCDYQSQSEKLKYAELNIQRKEVVQDVTVCSKQNPSVTGSISCSGLNTSKNVYSYELTGSYTNSVTVIGDSGITRDKSTQYGAAGLLMTFVLFLFVTGATSFRPVLGVAIGTVTLLVSGVAGFLALTPTMRATLIGLAIVIGVVMNQ